MSKISQKSLDKNQVIKNQEAKQFIDDKLLKTSTPEEINRKKKKKMKFQIIFYSAVIFAILLVIEFILILIASINEIVFIFTLIGLSISFIMLALISRDETFQELYVSKEFVQ